jgi:hypothetical protein
MNLSLARIPDVENILATDLKAFFDSDMPFTSLFQIGRASCRERVLHTV